MVELEMQFLSSNLAAQPFVAADAAIAARGLAGLSRRVYGYKSDSALTAAPLNSTVGRHVVEPKPPSVFTGCFNLSKANDHRLINPHLQSYAWAMAQ